MVSITVLRRSSYIHFSCYFYVWSITGHGIRILTFLLETADIWVERTFIFDYSFRLQVGVPIGQFLWSYIPAVYKVLREGCVNRALLAFMFSGWWKVFIWSEKFDCEEIILEYFDGIFIVIEFRQFFIMRGVPGESSREFSLLFWSWSWFLSWYIWSWS
jgi:hypothetical protein